jgi:hypothetical protein
MRPSPDERVGSRAMLGMLAACCVGPMLLIVVLTTVAGVALGTAAVIALGAVAAVGCVVLMVLRHRRTLPDATEGRGDGGFG